MLSPALSSTLKIVVDTHVLIGAMLAPERAERSASRAVLRRCLLGLDTPLLGAALFTEMRDVPARETLFARAPLSASERALLFEDFCHSAQWVRPYFLWRPDLPDEADNHVLELALGGGAAVLVTRNVRDFVRGELRTPGVRVLSPAAYLAERATEGE